MDFELRPVTKDEVPKFLRSSEGAFGVKLEDEALQVEAAEVEVDRTLAAFDGDDIAATAGVLSLELTLPGGGLSPVAGVSYVGVQTTHRRLGLLRAMMRSQLDDLHDRGESLAVLNASEGGIYGRFGYGPATFVAAYDIERPTGLQRQPDRAIRLVSVDEAAGAFPAVYEEARKQRVGEVSRAGPWWDGYFYDHEGRRSGAGPMFHALRKDLRGEVDGYVSYRFDRGGERGDTDRATVRVEELCAISETAYADLWAYVGDVDLTRGAQVRARPLQEPLRWMLRDPRRLRLTWMQDHLWVRLVDLPAALEARSYAASGSFVIQVEDEFCPWNHGRWMLETGGNGAIARTAGGQAPDLSLSAADLGSTYLGGVSFSELARAGRVVEQVRGAAGRADAMFGCDPPPFCATEF